MQVGHNTCFLRCAYSVHMVYTRVDRGKSVQVSFCLFFEPEIYIFLGGHIKIDLTSLTVMMNAVGIFNKNIIRTLGAPKSVQIKKMLCRVWGQKY